ncbi:hypothetical protein [Symmachiella dynata]|uniref:hypothetical protein n=1 Tax=Symmachiella dynata TaxID=2527995 RepID=UPI0030EBCD9E
MSLLGDFLEKFYAGSKTFRTVHAIVEHQWHASKVGPSRHGEIGEKKKGKKRKKPRRELIEMWAMLPDSFRVDATRKFKGTEKTRTDVSQIDQQLRRTFDGDVEVKPARETPRRMSTNMPQDYRRHFDPGLIREFFHHMYLEENGKTELAGRECVRFRGVPLPGDMLWPHWLNTEADAFEFAADITHSSLLSIKALYYGKTIEKHEVIKITYDTPIEASVFTCEPTDGGMVKTANPIFEQVSLEAAIERVPFAVLCPANSVDTDWNLQRIHYHYARAKDPEYLTLYFFSSKVDDLKPLWVRIQAVEQLEDQEKFEWEKIQSNGRLFKLSDPKTKSGTRIVAFEQNGTHVYIYSSVSRSELLDFARSLEMIS